MEPPYRTRHGQSTTGLTFPMAQKSVSVHQRYSEVIPYITKDASEIRELVHPLIHGNSNQSLAEAIVPVGHRTLRHQHRRTEEIYHITQGVGLMTLGDELFEVQAKDTICIPPGTDHCIENTGSLPLIIMCACCPPYSHDDTFIS